MNKPVVAVDVGGVLASKSHDGEPREGSLIALQQLAPHFDLWIVSMSGKLRARYSKKWLHWHGFDLLIPESKQIYIPFEDANKNTELRMIQASYFVDDRMKHIGPALNIPGLTCFHMYDVRPHWGNGENSFYVPVSGWTQIVEVMLNA